MIIIRKNPKLGNYMHYLHQSEARYAGPERVLVGYQQIQVGEEEVQVGEDANHLPIFEAQPVYGDDLSQPIYKDGADLFAADWDEAWGEPPPEEELAAWKEPEPDPPSPVTDIEIMTGIFTNARNQASLFLDQLKGTVWNYLVNVQEVPPNEATAQGVMFNLTSDTGIGAAYDDFVKNGGHPVAAAALWARIQAVKEHYTWLTPEVEAIFSQALGV